MPEFGSITTVGSNTQRIEVKLKAVNKYVARQRARSFLRRHYPAASITLASGHTKSDTKQGTLSQFFPERIDADQHSIFLNVTTRGNNS